VFVDCLFDVPTAERHGPDAPPKCKKPDTRRVHICYCYCYNHNYSLLLCFCCHCYPNVPQAALGLLRELAVGSEANFDELLSLIDKHHIVDYRPPSEWDYAPNMECRSDLGYFSLSLSICLFI
jgi:hypothetical protein